MGDSQHSLFAQFIFGVIASCTAVTFSNPFEVVKTRLQLQGELQRRGVYVKAYRGMLHGFIMIIKNDGILGLQKGLLLAYPYTITMNGIRLGLYATVKNKASEITGFGKSNVLLTMISGFTAGFVGSVLANPFYVAKTRLQSHSELLPVGYQHGYSGPIDSLYQIYKEEGLMGYTRGLQAAIIRTGVASAVQLATYDKVKMTVINHFDMKDDFLTFVFSSFISSISLTLSLNPFDVVLTRLQNQEVKNGKGLYYKGWFDCVVKIVQTEGFHGFYKGTLPHYARLAPHTIILLGVFESVKKLATDYNIKF